MMRPFYPGETNGLIDPAAYHDSFRPERTVDWTTKGLRITRLRLLSDPGFPLWDVSYCHGRLPDGTAVNVSLPFHQLPKAGMYGAIVRWAKFEKIFAKRVLPRHVISTLC